MSICHRLHTASRRTTTDWDEWSRIFLKDGPGPNLLDPTRPNPLSQWPDLTHPKQAEQVRRSIIEQCFTSVISRSLKVLDVQSHKELISSKVLQTPHTFHWIYRRLN